MSLTKHLQRNPTHEKGHGRPLPSRGTPLTNLTTVKLSRKRCPKTSGRTCVESMLCKVHPELYVPPWPNPQTMHLTCAISRGWVCCADLKWSSQWWQSVGWADLICWSDVAVVVCSDGLILVVWSDDGLVWELVHGLICGRIWDSSDCLVLWSDLGQILWAALVVWFYGLIWRSDWGRWSGLTAKN